MVRGKNRKVILSNLISDCYFLKFCKFGVVPWLYLEITYVHIISLNIKRFPIIVPVRFKRDRISDKDREFVIYDWDPFRILI